ncbi:MAG: hypothetical protein GX606_05885 [Elusimicrobia bacterium]|nr:hypothetical protein [Elusimicrobiota bacterium]
MSDLHSFHIPVMGTGFTIDSPVRVARYGISSVISLVDDTLIEDVRRFYALRYNEPYAPINKGDEDWRARRITAYLDLLDRIVTRQFEDLKKTPFTPSSEITKYFTLLPDSSPLKGKYLKMLATSDASQKLALEEELRGSIATGRIDVNIMTKLDRINYGKTGEPLPDEYSDALAALRGFAKSTVRSGIVLSAGFNRKLYSYIEEFDAFFPDKNGLFQKEIILKVSDYRSAITQGKFLAKKGLWVSEYRVESGLNCGGHAFAGQGNLIGPILEEFKQKRSELIEQLSSTLKSSLEGRGRPVPTTPLSFRLTAQGGIGTVNEDAFLKRYYGVVSTGWGSPFLLVPEAVQMDRDTLNRLAAAGEQDIFLSDVSPLNVAFNNLRTSLSEIQKCLRIRKDEPGSPCLLGHLANNTEFTKSPICTASRVYQKLKLEALKARGMPKEEYEREAKKITDKACICAELGHGVYKNENIVKSGTPAPAVCPGPNIAYFNRPLTLKEMINHIYGRANYMPFRDRPHMFIKELHLNIDQFARLCEEHRSAPPEKRESAITEFRDNLTNGISYYRALAPQIKEESEESRARILTQLDECEHRVRQLIS